MHTATNRATITLLSLLTVTACGGSDSPTAPTPRFPQVAGAYAGTITITYPQLGRTLVCPATTTVNQTGGSLSVAPMAISGACGALSLPVGDLEIDVNGSVGTETGTLSEPSCGVYQYVASGGFFGREFRFSMVYSSGTCLNFNISGTLTR